MSVSSGGLRRPQTPGRERTAHQPHSCSSRPSPAIKRRGTGAPVRRKGLQERLQHVSSILEALPVSGPDYAYREPVLGPQLKVYAVPEGCGGGGAPLGLSKRLNSQNRSRSGISGISASGRRFLKDSLLLMDDFRERLGFWTVTLRDEDYREMAGRRIWPIFQRRVIDLLLRELRDHGDEALAVGAVEIGALRTRRTKRPMPHIHIVSTGWGKKRSNGRWLCSPEVMDHIVAKAAQYAGLKSRLRPSASTIQPVRKSCHSYLSKYLTKDPSPELMDLSDGWDELIPRQWWQASAEARALVHGHLCRLPAAFAAFLVQRQKELEAAALVLAHPIQIAVRKTICGDVPIEVTRFSFRGTDAILQCLEYYALWCIDPEIHIEPVPPMS